MARNARNIIAKRLGLALLGFAFVFLQSCREHDIAYPLNEEELITTVTLIFRKLDHDGNPMGEAARFSWRDEDGSGDPQIDTIDLSANTAYALSLEILDESKTPPGDITTEVRSEGQEHQFFFITAGPDLAITYEDADEAGQPVGLLLKVAAKQVGAGSLIVVLRHQPAKTAQGVSEGDITNAGGDTDIEATFPFIVTP